MGNFSEQVYDIIDTVGGSLERAEEIADTAMDQADSFMSALSNSSNNIVAPRIQADTVRSPRAPTVSRTYAPSLASIPGIPPNPVDVTIPSFSADVVIPTAFSGTAPTLVIGTAPAFNGIVPDAPTIDTSFTVPVFGGVELPAAPALLEIVISPFGGTTLPTFSETAPILDIIEPSTFEYTPGADYTSTLMSLLATELEDRIVNGGTGLPAAAENAIWDREREREAIATRDALQELDKMEDLGYSLPPGQYTDARLKITTEMHVRTVSLGREIMVKQAELELDNVKHALGLTLDVEKVFVELYNERERRVFEALKYATEAGVAIYNAKVQGYLALVDAYKAAIAVFEAEVQAALTNVEAYKAEVSAEEAKAKVNVAKVEAYKALIQGSLANVDVYKAEVSAVIAQAELEKVKTEIYRAEVQGFAATVDAYTGEVEGFRATVGAEGVKQDAYKSQVQAYTAEVQGAAAASAANTDVYRAQITGIEAKLDLYKTEASVASDNAKLIAAQNSTLIDAYRASATTTTAYNEAITKQWQVSIESARASAEIGVATSKASADAYLTARSLSLDSSKVGAQVSAQLAAAAMSAVNYSLTGSGSAAISDSYTVSRDNDVQTVYNL